MTYLQQNKSLLKKKPVSFYVIIILIVVLIIFFVLPLIKNSLNYLGRESLALGNSGSDRFYKIFSIIKSKNSLYNENQILRNKIESLNSLLIRNNYLEKENTELREKINRVDFKANLALAYVISGPSNSLYDTLLIDIGKNAGLKVGDKVFSLGNPIGNIAKVDDESAIVDLYSSPNKEFEIRIGDSGIITIAYGRGGGNFFAKLPRESDVKEGDMVFSYSISHNPIAIIEHIDMNPSDSYQKIYFKSPVNIFELKDVEVEI